jgi:hypothetical protein
MLACFFITKAMKKKHCGDCIFLKYVDVCGDGYCEQLEEADVNVNDEACVLIEEKESKNLEYE